MGIRDLATTNDALLMKALWKVASNSDSQWVNLVKAKYFLRSFLWLSRRVYKCTKLWRALMHLRPNLTPMVGWVLREATCMVYGQPWHPGALELRPEDHTQSKLQAIDRLMTDGQSWDI